MIKHIFKLLWNKKGSNALMILEIFLSFIVLFFVLSYVFFNFDRVNQTLGFETENIWMIELDAIDKLDSLEAVTTLQNLKRNLLSLDEIEAVSFTESIAPFKGNQWRSGNSDNGFPMNFLLCPSDLDLLNVAGLNVVEGRWYREGDQNETIKPIVVNQAFVDKFYPGKSMIDSVFIYEGKRRLVGIIDEYRYIGEFAESEPTVMALTDYFQNMGNVLLKMQGDIPASFEEKLYNLTNTTTKSTSNTITTLEEERKKDSNESWVLVIALLFICGFLCINVALGLFGVLWYNINKRKAEIGLRQALGAHSIDITKQFIMEILLLTFIAVGMGVFFAIQIPLLNVTEYADSLFYRSIIYSALIILLLVITCALFPSIQAARISPADSLHED